MAAVPRTGSSRRTRLIALVTLVLLLAALAFLAYWLLDGRYHVDTDDAYVAGNRDALTAQESGLVIAVNADDTTYVRRGQVLVRLDPTDANIALAAARARLALAVRQTRGHVLDLEGLAARLAAAQAVRAQALRDQRRAQRLFRGGVFSKAALEQANTAAANAQATVRMRRSAIARAHALVGDAVLVREPAVLAAEAVVRRAYIARSRVVLRAPVSGYVVDRFVQLGQQVRAGQALMTIIPLSQIWVTANFKEPQLRSVRLGQEVRLTSDWYGDDVVFHGRVAGIGAGSGSAFSLLPPENASGNWIKIVQRVPVRITLSPREITAHPLRIGLSMDAVVTVGPRAPRQSWKPSPVHYRAPVSVSVLHRADQMIDTIVRQNSGRS